MRNRLLALLGAVLGLGVSSAPPEGFGPLRTAFRNPTSSKPTKGRKAGAYGRGLQNHFNRQRLKACKRRGPVDKLGAYTLIGQRHPFQAAQLKDGGRRMWLGGISAMRGY